MAKDEKELLNLNNIDPARFELVNKDVNAKIHDQKFETKPTTFAKDALKRFAKNKSSVVGACIIGALLFGSFLSLFSPHNIKKVNSDETLLPAKIFKAGTGWWDGCNEYKDVAYNDELGQPVGVVPEYCYNVRVSGEKYSDAYFEAAKGGSYALSSRKAYANPAADVKKFTYWAANYLGFSATSTENLKVQIQMDNSTETYKEAELCESYKVDLYIGAKVSDHQKTGTLISLQDYTTSYEALEFNVSEILAANSLTEADNLHVIVTAKPKLSENLSFMLIKSVLFTTDDTNEEKLALLNELSITDGNKTAGYGPLPGGGFPTGYWQSTGTRSVYHAVYKTCSYRYDEYSAKLGDKYEFTIGESLMNTYINNGWCEFEDFNDPTTFKVLSKDCPVKSVQKVLTSPTAGQPWQWEATVTYYKYKGYKSMPSYVFGTDASGHDLLTVAFSSLKTSLLVAIISSAICLAIGLVWGSISGYFGGNVDIIMERITDILGGVPWIIMMTLIILLLGNNIVTFGFALVMTGWIGTASRTRTQFYRFKGREYILASRTLGASDMRLIFRHILPNGLGTIVTGSVLMIPGCIFSEASISYLGLGLKGIDSFGVLLSSNQQYLSTRPLLVLIPALIISLLMISFNLFGNGLRDALNPTLKGGE